ncbi:hypothetical protein ACFOMH_11820 [Paracoccus mangrovi]|uniref:Uncharacterized protein n=1 Tax=Paracoccus mangrovi TaxID=1715645 RepID=A0ABV7R452_9RHOB
MIDRNAPKAEKFVVVAERTGSSDAETVTFVFDPTTTLQEVFAKLFAASELSWRRSFRRIAIYPDENTVPEDEILSSIRNRRASSEDPFGFDEASDGQDKGKN